MIKLVHSRLLIGDFIPNDEEEIEIINKFKDWGFTEGQHNDNVQIKFSTDKIEIFLGKLKTVCKHDADILDYIDNIFFCISKDNIPPLKVIVIEVILNNTKLQKLNKDKMESEISRLSSYLGECFNADSIINRNLYNNLNILNFSCKAIHNITIRNFVAEFFISAESEFISDLNEKLCWLETSDKAKFIGNDKTQHEKNIKYIKDQIISIDPLSFNGSEFYRSIVHGYGKEMFIIGKIGQGNLKDSPPLYLAIISEESATPKSLLDKMPVLQSPGYPFLDLSYGAGQILLLQLLNSWNRYVEKSINDITTKHTSFNKDNKNFDNVIKELHDLISYIDTNEKIFTNFGGNLQNLISPTKNTPLHEVLILLKEDSPLLINPEKYGLEKPVLIISNLTSLIIDYLDLNEKNLRSAIDLRQSEIELLKIEEDRKYSSKMVKYSIIMLRLTIVIAIATIVNVVLFILRI